MSPNRTTDLERLQGTWRITALEMDGAEMPDVSFTDATIAVRGDQFTTRTMGTEYSGTIEIESGKTPKAVDLVFTAGPPAGLRNRGIYSLDGDTWTLCLATRGDARPRSFRTRADTGIALETLERDTGARGAAVAKPRAKTVRATPAEAPSGTPTEIEGEFPMVSAVLDGKPLPPDMVKWCKRVTRGDVTKVLAGPQSMVDATFTLDPSRTPRHIGYLNRSGANKGKSQAGIYEIAGGILRICMAAPGDARPADFTSKKGDGRSLTEWVIPLDGTGHPEGIADPSLRSG